MDPLYRVTASFDFKQPDYLPQCNFFTDSFIFENKIDAKNLYTELDYEMVPLFANLAPDVMTEYQPDDDGTYHDGWGRRLRKTPASGFVEVLQYAPFAMETLKRFRWEPADLPDRFEIPVPDNMHHPGPFTQDLKELAGKHFVSGNVYDPFETLARVIGLKNALVALKTSPDELKPAMDNFGKFMTELGIAQLKMGKGAINALWIWGDIAYNRGLIMSPETYKELILPSLKKMCNAFKKENVKIVYHTDGNPGEVLPDLVDAGIDALHPTERVQGMELEKLIDDHHGKLSFIGGIPPLPSNMEKINKKLEQELLDIIKFGENGGLIPGFTNFIPSKFNINLLREITNFIADNHY